MPESLCEGEVIVTLSCLSPTTLAFPQRRLLLSNRKNVIPIGRASKRSATLESRMYNAWVDAPVMSRQHAELRLDTQGQTIFIRDLKSLHGTFHNGVQLRAGQSQALKNGDMLKFGICIDRGHESFPQCVMKVGLEFGQAKQAPVAASLPRATVFQVPDDTESEDFEDMNDNDSQAAFSSVADDEDLHASASTLTEKGLELSEFHGFDTSDPIDLISEPDLISDGNNPSSSSPLSDGYNPTTQDADHAADYTFRTFEHAADYTLRTVEHEDVDLGAQDRTSIALLSDGFAPAQGLKEGLSEEIAAGNTVPGMDGPLSEDQHLSPSSEITPLLRVQSLGESSGKLDYFIAREENKQYIQNAIASRDAQAEFTPPPQQEAPRSYKDIEGPLKEARGSSNTDGLHEASASKADELEEVTSVVKSVSKKRKADEMESNPPEVHVDDGSPAASSADHFALPRDVLPNGDGTCAYKRVKTAAEYVGLMAIGGAAVMTALIVTAPNF